MFLNDTSFISTTQSETFDSCLRPRLVFCGESIETEYYVAGLQNVPIHRICAYAEEQRKILEYWYGEVTVWLVTNDGYFGGSRYRSWHRVLEQFKQLNRY
jgi:hypothetical protein